MTTRRQLTAQERDRVRCGFVRATGDREFLQRLAREFDVTFESVSRVLPFQLWRTHSRLCNQCGGPFEERRPPLVDPRANVCDECVAGWSPMTRVVLHPRPRSKPGGRQTFEAPCSRGCGRNVHGYLTEKTNGVPGVCCECVAADHHQQVLETWRARR